MMRAVAVWGAVVAAAIIVCVLVVIAPLVGIAVIVIGSFAVAAVVRARSTARVHMATVIPFRSRSAASPPRVSRDDVSA